MALDPKSIYEQRLIISYTAIALAVTALYDHCITLDGEIEVIWCRSKWTPIQLLFIVNRYLCDALLIYSAYTLTFNVNVTQSDLAWPFFWIAVRQNPFKVVAWGALVAFWAMQGIVMFRISSMYSHSRRMIITLLSAFAMELVVTGLTQVVGFPTTHDRSLGGSHPPVSEMPICAPPTAPWWTNFFFWGAIVLFEVFILVLSVYKGAKTRREVLELRKHALSEHPSLMYVLLRDSILFPFASLSVCILNYVGSLYFSFFLAQFSTILAIFTTHVIGARLILNLREAYYQPFDDEYSQFQPGQQRDPIVFSPVRAESVYYDIAFSEA